ncbi:ABC transporter substrate-binding protein [Selenomonas sp. F0473]|uniref:ABC transporter substrate-binding protein n=1 Tax=Selenomonas sp. F0473 TaxID=999423 RepID=UPI00029EA200|nr:ABC transporter substrate-binding protein [Selenomonas sp. F0473]EKU71012.1 hypothetical protein HMPREF9161_01106 [Selenomonas sp. F0473]
MRNIFGLLILLLILTAFLSIRNGTVLDTSSADKPTSSSAEYPPVAIDTYDSNKRPVKLVFDRVPTRVFVQEVNTLETLFALGLGDRVAAASLSTSQHTYDRLKEEYPEEFARAKNISRLDLSQEQTVACRPDFILGWKSTFTAKRYGTTAWWQARGVKTYIVATSNHVLRYGTVEDECKFIDDMGRIFDVRERSDMLIREIHTELASISSNTAASPAQKIMVVEISKSGIMNYDEGWIVGDMVRRLGGYMPAHGRSVSAEDLIAYDPDVIFVVYFNPTHKEQSTRFFEDIRFNSLRAVKNGRIRMLPFGYMYTPAVKTIDGLRTIKRGMYPE